MKQHCKICGGPRGVVVAVMNGKKQSRCEGCGSPVANAHVSAAQVAKKAVKSLVCPKCGGRKADQLEMDRWQCQTCGTHFEKPDVGYLDTRPDVNAEKKERLQ